jgi:uncharacterized DUF497 family protein
MVRTANSSSVRELIVGQSALRCMLVVVFMECDADETRIISDRSATGNERWREEEG